MIISWPENSKNIIICNAFLKYMVMAVKPQYLPKSIDRFDQRKFRLALLNKNVSSL